MSIAFRCPFDSEWSNLGSNISNWIMSKWYWISVLFILFVSYVHLCAIDLYYKRNANCVCVRASLMALLPWPNTNNHNLQIHHFQYRILHNNCRNCMSNMVNHFKCLSRHFGSVTVNCEKKGKDLTNKHEKSIT